MSEIGDDIKALSENLAADAKRVAAIEEEKSRLDPRDPRLLELAKESERLTAGMRPQAQAEVELAERAAPDR